ncbi:hypothetical protein [Mycolicibacterium fortuitum]|uniref:hypothetical protein n=1 Tax=Mycolicibacterium fortuitum TaxID=1766 RepID=UPI00261ECD76|nr:hypothetical protein [Mycolicibacterium fortuitum]
MNVFARTALAAAAHVADRTLTTLCPKRGADRGHAAAHELASTAIQTKPGARPGGAGHPKK